MQEFHNNFNTRKKASLERTWTVVCDSSKETKVSLVENMVKKNYSRFPIAVLLTTLICSQLTIADLFFFSFTTAILKFLGHVIHHWKGILKTYLAVY